MRLLLSGGGTAGHVYPALAVVSALQSNMNVATADLLWVGSHGGMEGNLVPMAGLPFASVPAGGLRGMSPWTAARNVARLTRGYIEGRGILARFRPTVVFATGGYVGVPVVLAARQMGIPSLLYLPDIVPGLAIKALSRLVDTVCVTFDISRRYLPAEKVIATGYPVRAELMRPGDRAASRRALGLGSDRPVVLIFGGSRGARRINQAAFGAAARLAERAEVVHVTGPADAEPGYAVTRDLPETARERYHVYPYLHAEMADALRAADLIVSRAGAAILGEYPAVGVPAILVPLPIAGGHQWPNAQYLADRDAAAIVADADLTPDRLWQEVSAALDDSARLTRQAAAMRALAVPDAARRIAAEIARLSDGARRAPGDAP